MVKKKVDWKKVLREKPLYTKKEAEEIKEIIKNAFRKDFDFR